MKKIALFCIASFAAGFFSAMPAANNYRATPADGTVEGMVNGSRIAVNKNPISTETLARICARNHTVKMMREQNLRHSTNRELTACLPDAKVIGENVGVGVSASEIHSLMWGSSSHKRNIVNSGWRWLGGSAEYDGSSYWVTQIYWRP